MSGRVYRILGPANPLDAIGLSVQWMGEADWLVKGRPGKDLRRYGADTIAVAEFTDGRTLVCVTDHNGPYSELTPDVDTYTDWFWVTREAA